MMVIRKGNILAPEKIEKSSYDSLINLFKFVWINDKSFIVNFLKMITENPGKRLKLKKGRIEKGYDADLLIFDNKLKLLYVITKGMITYAPTI